MKFATWLRKAREGRKFSRPDLARRLGIHPNTVTNYESGINLPNDEVLERIALVFGETFRNLWAFAHEKEHKRIVEILSRAEKKAFEPGSITDPEMKEIVDILNRHPRLKQVALGALRPLDTPGANDTDQG